MDNKYIKIQAGGCSVPIKMVPGHFATNHAHVNYYIDLTTMKTRVSEAQEVAKSISDLFMFDTVVDTIVCLEGTEVIGAFLASELTKSGFLSMNAHKTIYVVTPEYNNNSQIIFRENLLPMIKEKNVVLLAASVTTGLTLNKAIEAIQYYGGNLRSISAIFSAIDALNDIKINAVFGKNELSEYQYYDYRNCPFCKKGIRLEGLINTFGCSRL